MEENRFEKQVKDKMEGLNFQPSETVWTNIKAGIKEKRRSQWGILLLFFMIAAGSYVAWNAMQKRVSDKSDDIVQTFYNKIPSENDSVYLRNLIVNTNSGLLKDKSSDDSIEVFTLKRSDKIGLNPAVNKPIEWQQKGTTDEKLTETVTLSNQQQNDKSESNELNSTSGVVKEKTTQEIVGDKSYDSLQPNANDTFRKKENKVTTYKKETSSNKSIPSKQENAKSKWRVGFSLAPGLSFANKSLLTSGSSNAAYSAAFPSSVNGQGMATNSYKYSLHSGFGFIAGIFAERNITRKTTLSAGVNFASFSSKNRFADSVLNYYAISRVNQFNYIQLPFLLKIHINKSSRFPLYLQTGVTLSTPVNTGVAANKLFYNKIQAGINGALLASLFSMNGHQVLMGPYYYYNTGKIAGEGLYNQKHISFIGLRAELIFNK